MEVRSLFPQNISRFEEKPCVQILTAPGVAAASLDKNYEEHPVITLVLKDDPSHVSAVVPIFWLDVNRETNADMYWKKYKSSIKFKVSDGVYKGFVGYFRPVVS